MSTKSTDPTPTKRDVYDDTLVAESGEFQRLCQQVQDLKNFAYQSMSPDNQTRLDAVLTTVNAIKNKPYGPR